MKQIAYNRTERKEKPKFIVIHCTGNPKEGANANAHFRYWNSGNVGQSADFVVDDKEALQINDYKKYYTWHCGDGKGKYGITNSNSIGIEICVNRDGDFDKAVENTIHLVRRIMGETGIYNVVRHYDASRKICPAEMAENNWAKWNEFKRRVAEMRELTSINDIVWELADRNIITDVALWMTKLEDDENIYWLARKCVHYLRGRCV
ncbi:MAG: N-acetylmuramoyl-L-alanine amidase [Clostridia bacterium]|nr:N-acetylmuramoyl-L-alanine amidase [Clostridia bacterium]